MLDKKIKIFHYRNACFQGYLNSKLFQGIGSVLTENFLFITAVWNQGKLNGPAIMVFPSQKILYGDFEEGQQTGLFCFEISQECQFYMLYQAGKLHKIVTAVFPDLKCLLCFTLTQNNEIQHQKQHPYQKQQQKWDKMSQIMDFRIPQYMKNHRNFVKQSFIEIFSQTEQIQGEQYYFGMGNQGLGFKMYLQSMKISSMGHYNSNKFIKQLGKRVVNKKKRVKQSGIFSKPQTLILYQVNDKKKEEKEEKDKKYLHNLRNYFKESTNFVNQFIVFHKIQQTEAILMNLKQILQQKATDRIAQQLIEHLEQDQSRHMSPIQQKYLDSFKPMQEVTADKIKVELSKSINKIKKGNFAYKNINLEPAELHEKREIISNQSLTIKRNEIGKNMINSFIRQERDKNEKYGKTINRNIKESSFDQIKQPDQFQMNIEQEAENKAKKITRVNYSKIMGRWAKGYSISPQKSKEKAKNKQTVNPESGFKNSHENSANSPPQKACHGKRQNTGTQSPKQQNGSPQRQYGKLTNISPRKDVFKQTEYQQIPFNKHTNNKSQVQGKNSNGQVQYENFEGSQNTFQFTNTGSDNKIRKTNLWYFNRS